MRRAHHALLLLRDDAEIDSPNHKGTIAEAAIALEAACLGVEVFKPLSEHSRADMIFQIAGSLYRVQCKTPAAKARWLSFHS